MTARTEQSERSTSDQDERREGDRATVVDIDGRPVTIPAQPAVFSSERT